MKHPNYDLSDFNDDGTLKVPLLLWLVMAFLARHVLLLMMGALSTLLLSRKGVDTGGFAALYSSPVFLLASAPAVAVIVAGLRRAPKASPLVRTIWHNGRLLLLISAGIDLGLLVCFLVFGWLSVNGFVVATVALEVYVVFGLVKSVRVKDTFADFPAPCQEKPLSGT